MGSVLFVDDEPRIVGFVTRALDDLGIDVAGEVDSRRALRRVLDDSFDLVLLDLMMPGIDGVTFLRRILAARPSQRVMVISALSDVRSKVRCLELGAIDFLPKPFALAELVARVRVHLRRGGDEPGTIRRAGRVRIDLERRTADGGGGSVPVTARELDLLRHLIDRSGQVCPRTQLLSEVWGTERTDGNVVDACVRRLRAKLGPDVIDTVRAAGYRLGE